jgi:hypothetical protein
MGMSFDSTGIPPESNPWQGRCEMRRWSRALLFCLALPLVAKEKKLIGDILERDLFLKGRTFCVDASTLSAADAQDVRRFLDAESKPKKLLSKIPW